MLPINIAVGAFCTQLIGGYLTSRAKQFAGRVVGVGCCGMGWELFARLGCSCCEQTTSEKKSSNCILEDSLSKPGVLRTII